MKQEESKIFQHTLIENNVHSLRCLHSFVDPSTGFVVTFFVGDSNNQCEISTALLWIKLDLNLRRARSIPSSIPLENTQCLTILNGHLEKLWLNDARVFFPILLKVRSSFMVNLAFFYSSIS